MQTTHVNSPGCRFPQGQFPLFKLVLRKVLRLRKHGEKFTTKRKTLHRMFWSTRIIRVRRYIRIHTHPPCCGQRSCVKYTKNGVPVWRPSSKYWYILLRGKCGATHVRSIIGSGWQHTLPCLYETRHDVAVLLPSLHGWIKGTNAVQQQSFGPNHARGPLSEPQFHLPLYIQLQSEPSCLVYTTPAVIADVTILSHEYFTLERTSGTLLHR